MPRRGLLLAALTIVWNVIEAIVAISAGAAAGSIALIGFGFDSSIEVRLSRRRRLAVRVQTHGGYDQRRERTALRLIAMSFLLLATYVVIEAAHDLFFDRAHLAGLELSERP